MNQDHCPRCASQNRAEPRPVSVAGTFGNYTCRDAWHMPSLQSEAKDALDFVADVDRMFGGDFLLTPAAQRELDSYDPTRVSTAGYP